MSKDPKIEYYHLTPEEKAETEKRAKEFIDAMRLKPCEAREIVISAITAAFCVCGAENDGERSCQCQNDE